MNKTAELIAGMSPCEFCGNISTSVIDDVAVCSKHRVYVQSPKSRKTASRSSDDSCPTMEIKQELVNNS